MGRNNLTELKLAELTRASGVSASGDVTTVHRLHPSSRHWAHSADDIHLWQRLGGRPSALRPLGRAAWRTPRLAGNSTPDLDGIKFQVTRFYGF